MPKKPLTVPITEYMQRDGLLPLLINLSEDIVNQMLKALIECISRNHGGRGVAWLEIWMKEDKDMVSE